jgi:hypothetical protein
VGGTGNIVIVFVINNYFRFIMDMNVEGNATSLTVGTAMGKVQVGSQPHQEEQLNAMINPSGSLKTRPPRASRRPTHCHDKKPPSQPIGSVPQLRAPLSCDSTSYVGSMSRCTSQPRTSKSHFLMGFNVDDCFDVRSIPDPPSPIAPTRRTRRRLSTPSMMPAAHGSPGKRGLDDVTNNNRSSVSTKRNTSERKRKSLLHVPSPSADHTSEEVACTEERPPKVLQLNICMEDEEVERIRISHKRRKQRQSMIVPPRLNLSPFPEKNSSFSHPQAMSHVVEKSYAPWLPMKLFPGTKESMDELRALVRGYCNATDCEKSSIDRIQELTGYPMPGRFTTQIKTEEKVETDNDVIKANRRCVFSKISPAMALMEKQKEQDTKQWEDGTGCRVGKSNKSGKYRYFSTEDHQRVASQDYKRRYMAVLEHTRPNRVAAAQVWMKTLSETEPVVKTVFETDDKSCLRPIDYIQDTIRTVSHDASIDETDKDCASDELQEQQQREAFLPPMSNLLRRESTGSNVDDAMDLCDLSVSLDCGQQANVAQGSSAPTVLATQFAAEISEASSEDTEESESRTATPSPLPIEFVASSMACHAEQYHVLGPVLVAQSRDESADTTSDVETQESTKDLDDVPLLPLPSREVEALDPEIAQAEKRLWEKIDGALKEYSEEVMVITKARNLRARGKKQHASLNK